MDIEEEQPKNQKKTNTEDKKLATQIINNIDLGGEMNEYTVSQKSFKK